MEESLPFRATVVVWTTVEFNGRGSMLKSDNSVPFLIYTLTLCVCVPVMFPWVPGRVASG